MLDFIGMAPFDMQGARQKRQNAKWNIQAHAWTRTHSPEILIMLFQLSLSVLEESLESKKIPFLLEESCII